MDRRTFLSQAAGAAVQSDAEKPITQIENPFANKVLPKVQRAVTGLEPYTGPWGFDQVAHLLRRTMFGATRNDVTSMQSFTLDNVIEMLLADQPTPAPPINTNSSDTGAPVGSTWVNATSNGFNSSRNNSLKSWWVG